MIKSLDYTYIDKWQATENLVRSMINSIVNTASLAEVVAVEKDKVSVSELVIQKESTVPPVIYHNITVLIPSSDKFNITYPIKKGDKGLLITCKLDISELKKTKRSCKTNVARTFDKNDSVFIPLFMNTKPLQNEEINITHDKATIKIKTGEIVLKTEATEVVISKDKVLIKNDSKINLEVTDGDVELIAKNINLNCDKLDCSPIKKMLEGLKARCDALAKGMVGSGTNNTAYNTLKSVTESADDPFADIL